VKPNRDRSQSSVELVRDLDEEKVVALLRKKSSFFVSSLLWARCYETFYVRNLRMFVIARVLVRSKPIQPSLIFAGKIRST